MNETGKSDKPVVPMKSAKVGYWEFYQWCAERREGRGLAKENGQGFRFCCITAAIALSCACAFRLALL